MKPGKLARIIEVASGRQPPGHRLRRVILRLDPETIARLNALTEHFPDASRAAVIRALLLACLPLAERDVFGEKPAESEEGGQP